LPLSITGQIPANPISEAEPIIDVNGASDRQPNGFRVFKEILIGTQNVEKCPADVQLVLFVLISVIDPTGQIEEGVVHILKVLTRRQTFVKLAILVLLIPGKIVFPQ